MTMLVSVRWRVINSIVVLIPDMSFRFRTRVWLSDARRLPHSFVDCNVLPPCHAGNRTRKSPVAMATRPA